MPCKDRGLRLPRTSIWCLEYSVPLIPPTATNSAEVDVGDAFHEWLDAQESQSARNRSKSIHGLV